MSEPGDPRRRSQLREQDEPEELRNPTPALLLVFSLVLMGWGVWYYFDSVGYPLAAGDRRTPVVAAAGGVDGAQVYAANCVSCHQQNGQGLAGVFPPLVESRWVLDDRDRLVQIMLHGINGAIEVRGEIYRGVMPAFARLPDAELAAVTTYIRSSWENDAPPLEAADIAAGRDRFPDRTAPWAGGEELDAVFGED